MHTRRAYSHIATLAILFSLLTVGLLNGTVKQASAASVPTGPVTLHQSTPRIVGQGRATSLGAYDPNQVLRLVINLSPPHMAEEEQFIHDVETPGNSQFHHFLTPEEWDARFAPSVQDEQATVTWLQGQHLTVTHRYSNRLLVDVAAPVSAIDRAFNISINRYRSATGEFFSNDRDPTIPASLAGIVHSIVGLNSLEVMHPVGFHPGKGANGLSRVVTPGPARGRVLAFHGNGNPRLRPHATGTGRSGLAELAAPSTHAEWRGGVGRIEPPDLWSSQGYDVGALNRLSHCCNPTDNYGGTLPYTSIGIAAGAGFDINDIKTFAGKYGLAYNIMVYTIDGTPNCCTGNDVDEATMDVEASLSMSNSFTTWDQSAKIYVYEGGDNHYGTFEDIDNQMAADANARSYTVSWGDSEDDFESVCFTCIGDYHPIFDQMLGEGWSLTAAAGDNGAFNDCDDPNTPSVNYPASDSDFVSAGGTVMSMNSSGNFSGESAWTGTGCEGSRNNGGGGGGCSNYFSRPGFQPASIDHCNGMRNVPDVSLNAINQEFFIEGTWGGNGGTSLVSPELAGIFAQINSYLLYENDVCGPNGKWYCAPMGDPNVPIYYEAVNREARHNPFYDVTSGCNSGNPNSLGFCAAPGYDLATGWGSFNALQLAWTVNNYFIVDYFPPTVSFDPHYVGHWFNAPVTLNFTVSDPVQGSDPAASGVAGYTTRWDSDPGDVFSHAAPGCCDAFYTGPATTSTTGAMSLAPTIFNQGCHTPHVRVWDNLGLTNDHTGPGFCFDTFPPSVTNLTFTPVSPSNTVYLTTTVAAFDPGSTTGTGSGVQDITVSMNSAPDGSANGNWITMGTVDGASGQFGWQVPSTLADGNHLVQVQACDNTLDGFAGSGNCSLKQTHYLLDHAAPVTAALLTGQDDGNATYTSAVQVTLHATDALSGIKQTMYGIDCPSGHCSNPQLYSTPFTISTPGQHTVYFSSMDNAGNVEPQQSVGFTIADPTVTTLPVQAGATTTAVFKANVNLGGLTAGCVSFAYFTSADAFSFTSGQTVSGTGAISVGQPVSGLVAGTVYHVMARMQGQACGNGGSWTVGGTQPFLTAMQLNPGWTLVAVPTSEDTTTASALATDLNTALAGHLKALSVMQNGTWKLYTPGYSLNFALSFGEGIAVLSGDSTSHPWTPGGTILTTGGSIPLTAGWNLVAPVRQSMTEAQICSQTGATTIVTASSTTFACGTTGSGATIANAESVQVKVPTAVSWTQP